MGPLPIARMSLLHSVPDHLARAGVRADPIFRSAGIDKIEPFDGKRVISVAQICEILRLTARVLGDPAIALKIGPSWDMQRLGAVGRSFNPGLTVKECLQQYARSFPTLISHGKLELQVSTDSATLIHSAIGASVDGFSPILECATAFLIEAIRERLNGDWSPISVRLPRKSRGALAAHQQFFRAPIHFDDEESIKIEISTADSHRVLATCRAPPPHPSRVESCKGEFRDLLNFEVDASVAASMVTMIVEERLESENIGMRHVASVIGIPVRSLQRLLHMEGLRFEGIVDEIRIQKARHALRGGNKSITDVAMSLGYSDCAHFVRAFRRWTGYTPSEFRRA